MLADEVAGELVVAAVGEDEFNLVAGCEGVEVFEAEAVGRRTGTRTLDVDDLVHGFRNIGQGALARGFDHELEAAVEEGLHEGEEFAGLQHGFAAGELDQAAGRESVDLREDFVGGEGLTAREGVLGVAPGTAQVAAGKTHEDAGQAGEGAFALNGFVEFDEMHAS